MRGGKIVVLGTGGTIAGRAASAADHVGYQAGAVAVAELMGAVPVPTGCSVLSEQVAQLDSKDMDFSVWQALAVRCAHWLAQPELSGLVITHGTDTMEETAFFLQCVLGAERPVVLTGAMRPASAIAPDGPQNLADALLVAATPDAQGVAVVFAGAVHAACDVSKVHNYRLDAFSSGDAGPLGVVEAGVLRQWRPWPVPAPLRRWDALPDAAGWPWVEIVHSQAGADGRQVDALLAQGVQGLVVAGTGNGTLHHALEAALLRAQAQGVPVLRTSRTGGRVLPHPGDRLPAAEGLSPVKARIQLLLQLMR